MAPFCWTTPFCDPMICDDFPLALKSSLSSRSRVASSNGLTDRHDGQKGRSFGGELPKRPRHIHDPTKHHCSSFVSLGHFYFERPRVRTLDVSLIINFSVAHVDNRVALTFARTFSSFRIGKNDNKNNTSTKQDNQLN